MEEFAERLSIETFLSHQEVKFIIELALCYNETIETLEAIYNKYGIFCLQMYIRMVILFKTPKSF